MNLFEKKVLETINEYNMISKNDKVIVGLSGGADSSALLVVLKKLSENIGFSLCAAHLNHGIRGEEAIRDMNFSASLSTELNIPFYSKSVSVPQYALEKHISEEMAGRELRYSFFDELCKEYGFNKIAVAHNKNDSAETVLMNLARGAGSNGLSGISAVNGNIIRPIIKTSRDEIEEYVKENNINYVTDSTNNTDIYNRNILRNNIIPQLNRINTNAVNNIIRSSNILFDENDFISEFSKKLSAIKKSGTNVILDKHIFDLQHIAVKRKLIFDAIKELNGNTLNFSNIHAEMIISGCKTGSILRLPCKAFVSFEHDKIIFLKEISEINEYEYKVKIPGKLTVKETNLTYSFEIVDNNNLDSNHQYINLDGVDISSVTLRTKHEGEKFLPSGMNGSKKIKKFFIDCKIPKHERNKYPLLTINNDIAAILQLRVSRDYLINKDTKKILKITVSGGKNEREYHL